MRRRRHLFLCMGAAAGVGAGLLAPPVRAGVDCNVFCPADLDRNTIVDNVDLEIMLAEWTRSGCADLDGSGVVGGSDMGLLLSAWGPCAVPPACPEADHGCAIEGGPGCADVRCCEIVCALDPFCCLQQWDALCVMQALDTCGLVVNDQCAHAIVLTEGERVRYSTVGATTDGPPEARCGSPGEDQIHNDVWYTLVTGCDGILTVGVCDSDFDTRLALYAGLECPPLPGSILACSDDACGLQSVVMVEVSAGQLLTIRLGGRTPDDSGTGVLAITCGAPTCGSPEAGSCFETHPTPACDKLECCTFVCSVMPACCESEWDVACVAQAKVGCTSLGSCCDVLSTPGCDDETCEFTVCLLIPDCCESQWDETCVDTAAIYCEVCGGMPYFCGSPISGGCFDDSSTPACNDVACCEAVCATDPFCCEAAWDALCVGVATLVCDPAGACGGPATGSCFSAQSTPYCNLTACCELVCDREPSCCEIAWDDHCVKTALTTCVPPACGAGNGDCFESHPTPGCRDEVCCTLVCEENDYCCVVEWDEVCVITAIFTCR